MLKRVLSLLLTVVMTVSIIPLFSVSSQATREINPIMKYTDVKIGTWYYDAVKYSYTKGYMTGVDEKTFAPNSYVTRAAYVTVLSKTADVVVDHYSAISTLDDVFDGKWYTKNVNWALENNVMSGLGNNKFGVNSYITREQLVLSLYRFAEKNGYDMRNIKKDALDGFTDIDELHDWSGMTDAMLWAVSRGLISGKTGNRLAPRDTATRAELAQIIMKLSKIAVEKPKLEIKIDGVNISEFRIVFSKSATSTEKTSARELRSYIYKTNAVNLSLVTDAEAPTEHEILIGKTNREGNTVNIDRSALNSEETFLIKTENGNLVIAGGGDRGTIYGVYEFLEKYLEWRFYTEDSELCRTQKSLIEIDGVNDIQSPSFEYRDVHMMTYTMENIAVKRRVNGTFHRIINEDKGGKISFLGGDYYYVHSINKFLGKTEEYRNSCTSTSDSNLQLYMDGIEKIIAQEPDTKIVSFSACDSSGYWCTCAECKALDKQYPNKYDRWITFVNALADKLKEAHPDMKLLTLAYLESYNSNASISPRDNVILMICPMDESMTQDVTDTTNRNLKNCFTNFANICTNNDMYVWEYPVSHSDTMVGVPNVYSMVNHLRFYYSVGIKGVFMEGRSLDEISTSSGRIIDWENDGEFGNLKAYLASKLLWHASLTDEEIENLIIEYMQDFYGEEWQTVYDIFKQFANYTKQFNFSLDIFDSQAETKITGLFTTKEIRGMDEALSDAMDNTQSRSDYENLEILSIMIDGMLLNRLWSAYYRSTDTANRNYIISVNQRMYENMIKYNVYPIDILLSSVNKSASVFSRMVAKKLILVGK